MQTFKFPLEYPASIPYFSVMADEKPQKDSVRLDRWLMAARFYKTRSQSAAACEGGKVKVNGASSKPHKAVRVGDKLTVHVRGRYRNVTIAGLAERGLPPAVARTLYEEEIRLKPSDELLEQMRIFARSAKPAPRKFKGRPTKKERRDMEKLGEPPA
ncbi:MAG: RNA-binding S4 domain-containing protein [bacterium]|nr:RNA-binding S4 domain-containing protein [bacterium]